MQTRILQADKEWMQAEHSRRRTQERDEAAEEQWTEYKKEQRVLYVAGLPGSPVKRLVDRKVSDVSTRVQKTLQLVARNNSEVGIRAGRCSDRRICKGLLAAEQVGLEEGLGEGGQLSGEW